MKNKARKAMRTKLLFAFKKVIKDNRVNLSNKVEKALKKSIKKIVKKTDKKKLSISANKMRKPVLNPDKTKLDGVAMARPSKQTVN